MVAALEHKVSAKAIGISCRDALSVWAGFRALFFETGALSACLAFVDPPWIPLGISVDTSGLEIASLDL
ncbi:MAG: hypothetical protein AUI50_04465 [Crenarchaeota archaeon 13_1_40CM_2_52_14]|nr:MAG: hypothetical protein AUI97_08280 [Crenarchaeota archaeon 13_1_40CM_3_52_17]OLD34897.1 MAG: hypothetical protein AUI50_04465 [Crenarchaeota archaeon 13_1_40CM_2_52_14]OLE68736.1 MAG: hypothetical protein AUF78_14680 [archaeon 13_1_20CM_2_51_12]